MICGRNFIYNVPYDPFSLSTASITHNGNGSKQVDPRLTLYKRSKIHSLKVSSNHSLFFFSLCVKEKTDLTVGGSLAESHRSHLTVLSFFSGYTAITIAWSISTYWFLCFISWRHLWESKRVFINFSIFISWHRLWESKRVSINFSVFQDKKAAWFRLGQWLLVQDTKRVETPPVIQNAHHHHPWPSSNNNSPWQ